MSIWGSIKKAAIKAKCGIGFHGGILETPEGKPQCHLEKTCPDCMRLIVKKEHEYKYEWSDAPFDERSQVKCTRVQDCVHCGEIKKQEVHEEYRRLGINSKCQIVVACIRCGHEKTEDYDHSFVQEGIENEKSLLSA